MEIHGFLPLGCYAKRLCEQRPRIGIVPRFDGDVRCLFRMVVTALPLKIRILHGLQSTDAVDAQHVSVAHGCLNVFV